MHTDVSSECPRGYLSRIVAYLRVAFGLDESEPTPTIFACTSTDMEFDRETN